jgi:uncharacterized membrane protein YoaT (DUF817 family)
MCQAWRRLELRIIRWPHYLLTVPLGAAIYINFFTHHFIWDVRWFLTLAIFLVFIPTKVQFRSTGPIRRISLVLSFFLIGIFIWIAENIATLLGAWQYPNQRETWEWVHLSKISSWFLLVIVSFIIVAQLKHVKKRLDQSKMYKMDTKSPQNHSQGI